MRVITGTARGRKLRALDGQAVRPTADRVKEAVFSIINFDIPNSRVLDLFAGSGQLGIEALSRGTAHCVFADRSPDAVEIIRENLQNTGLYARSRVVCCDYTNLLKNGEYDIAFLDPPYKDGLLEKALPLVAPRMSPRGIIICETDGEAKLPQFAGNFILTDVRRYGIVWIGIYKMENGKWKIDNDG